MSRYEELEQLVASMKEDFGKFYDDGNKAAGTRVRTGLQDVKKLAQDIRLEIQEIKNKA
ncbi:MAG: histone H1 [Anaerolineae bacterium]|nr:histone H1 [Anaerolineae bacterium]